MTGAYIPKAVEEIRYAKAVHDKICKVEDMEKAIY